MNRNKKERLERLQNLPNVCDRSILKAELEHTEPREAKIVDDFVLLNPRQFGLVSETPQQMATRSLVMIAKCLQNLANLVEFGGKEPYMEVVNPFILKNKERMIVFLDHLSNIKERPEPEDIHKLQIVPARDMGTLHHICVTNFKDLQAKSRTQPTIKKLATVTEMLSKHKQKYREMIRA